MKSKNNIDNNKMKFEQYSDVIETEKNDINTLYIAKDLNNKGAKQYAVTNLKALMSLSSSNENLYEIIHADYPSKMYIDLDCSYQKIKQYVDDFKDDHARIKKGIADTLEGWIEDFFDEYNIGDTPVIHISEACDRVKYSFHLAVDVRLDNQRDSQAFHNKFIQFIKSKEEYKDSDYWELYNFVDTAVYTKHRNFRMINQTKFASDRPLRIYSGSQDPKDHLISFVSEDLPKIKVPKKWFKKKKKINRVIVSEKNFDDDEELQYLVNNTLHRTKSYNEWISWIWACLGAGLSHELIHHFSKKGSPDNYDEESCDVHIRRYDHEKSQKLGLHTLRGWASSVGKDITRDVEVRATILPKLRKTHLTWIDLLKKYNDMVFESKYDMIYSLREDVSQVVSMIQGKSTMFTIYSNPDNPYDLTKELPRLNLMWNCVNAKGETFMADCLLSKLLKDNPLDFPLFNKLVFKPNNHNLRKNERNTYSGMESQPVPKVDMDVIAPLLFHIKNVLANGNEKHYLYIMSWIAKIIKTPWKPTDIFLLFQSKQGSGKTIVAEFLVKHVFGRHLSMSTSGISTLVQRFNGAIKSKLFVCCNELTNTDSSASSFHSAFDKMKNLITDRLIEIEPKGLETISIDNFCNFMGTTNHEFCAKLEASDRRYACFNASDEYCKDFDYFDKLGATLNQRTGDHFYTYLKQYPQELMVDLRRIPKTKLRETMISSSKSTVAKFLDDLIGEHILVRDENWINKSERQISNDKLFIRFLEWCCTNNEKTQSKSVFGRMLPKDYIRDKGRIRINKKNVRWVKLLNF